MTIVDGEFQDLSEDDIEQRIRDAFRAYFDDPDLTDGSVFSNLAAAYASVLAEQEDTLKAVYDAGFLDGAEGQALEDLVEIIGLYRRDAVHATGTVTFDHGSGVDQDYTIGVGETVTTNTPSGVAFETTEQRELTYFDGFEGADATDDWSGATGDYFGGVLDLAGSQSLASADGTESGEIYYDPGGSKWGETHRYRVYFPSGASNSPDAAFGYLASQSSSDGYWVLVEPNADSVTLIKGVFGGGNIVASATTQSSIPLDTWLILDVLPSTNGQHVIDLYDPGQDGLLLAPSGQDHTISWDEPTEDPLRFEGTLAVRNDGNGPFYADEFANRAVDVNVRAVEGGTVGNVGANTVTVMPSPIAGVNNVFNRYAIGEEDNFDTTDERFVAGEAAETDAELRARARRTSGEGGAATIDALIGAILDVDGVTSVTLYENDTDTDNTGTGGLPPVSFELVINGGDDSRIADAIHDTKAVTARDYAGAHGTATTADVTAINGQTFTMRFSRPTVLSVDMSLDLVVNDEYAGGDAVRNAVVDYVGGTNAGGAPVVGDVNDSGQDVIINRIENNVMDVAGVVGVDSSETTYTPSTTTDSNGLEVIDVGSNEIAETDATDGSITITTTTV